VVVDQEEEMRVTVDILLELVELVVEETELTEKVLEEVLQDMDLVVAVAEE
jgi:hypothetical protein